MTASAASPLTVEHLIDRDIAVISWRGQLVGSNRELLKAAVRELLILGRRKVVLDLSETLYVDSSALGALVTIAKRIREEGGQLILANMDDDLRNLFELTKLTDLFRLVSTRELAISALAT